jgi:hypothetical protein
MSNPTNTMMAIGSGLVGWLTFQAFNRRRQAYSEYFLYAPILELAMSQGWRVQSEYPVKKNKRGRPLSIDFVFEDSNGVVVGVEVKWISEDKHYLDMTNDVKKLNLLERKYPSNTVRKFLLICGGYQRVRGKKADQKKGARYKPIIKVKNQIDAASETHLRSGSAWITSYRGYHNKTRYAVAVVEIA